MRNAFQISCSFVLQLVHLGKRELLDGFVLDDDDQGDRHEEEAADGEAGCQVGPFLVGRSCRQPHEPEEEDDDDDVRVDARPLDGRPVVRLPLALPELELVDLCDELHRCEGQDGQDVQEVAAGEFPGT